MINAGIVSCVAVAHCDGYKTLNIATNFATSLWLEIEKSI